MQPWPVNLIINYLFVCLAYHQIYISITLHLPVCSPSGCWEALFSFLLWYSAHLSCWLASPYGPLVMQLKPNSSFLFFLIGTGWWWLIGLLTLCLSLSVDLTTWLWVFFLPFWHMAPLCISFPVFLSIFQSRDQQEGVDLVWRGTLKERGKQRERTRRSKAYEAKPRPLAQETLPHTCSARVCVWVKLLPVCILL